MDKLAKMISKLEAKAAEWQEAADQLEEDEPDDMETVENDAMAQVYSEAAGFLRDLIAEQRPAVETGSRCWSDLCAKPGCDRVHHETAGGRAWTESETTYRQALAKRANNPWY